MQKTGVLIVGGYGTVGKAVAEILAEDERLGIVIAGRNETKAREQAQKLAGEWRVVDIEDAGAIPRALTGMRIVVNCFGGPFTHAPLHLAQTCARTGVHYIDVSGSYEFTERLLALHETAAAHGAILITALGANPGIPGIAVMHAAQDFDSLASARILFALGAAFAGVSVSGLRELKHMLDVPARVWEKPHWVKPRESGLQVTVGAPFEGNVYFGASLTRDLLAVPELTGVERLSFWSGSQFSGQGLAMILGLKLGLANGERGARILLNLLKRMGKSPRASEDVWIQIAAAGTKNGARFTRTTEFYCEENYATALAPAIVCRQIVEGAITRPGAFVAPQVVPAADFMLRLRQYPIHYQERSGRNET